MSARTELLPKWRVVKDGPHLGFESMWFGWLRDKPGASKPEAEVLAEVRYVSTLLGRAWQATTFEADESNSLHATRREARAAAVERLYPEEAR